MVCFTLECLYMKTRQGIPVGSKPDPGLIHHKAKFTHLGSTIDINCESNIDISTLGNVPNKRSI